MAQVFCVFPTICSFHVLHQLDLLRPPCWDGSDETSARCRARHPRLREEPPDAGNGELHPPGDLCGVDQCASYYTATPWKTIPLDPENHWLVEENNRTQGGQPVRVYVSLRE